MQSSVTHERASYGHEQFGLAVFRVDETDVQRFLVQGLLCEPWTLRRTTGTSNATVVLPV